VTEEEWGIRLRERARFSAKEGRFGIAETRKLKKREEGTLEPKGDSGLF